MPNAVYGLGRQGFAEADISWPADAIRIALVNTALYAVSINTDEFLSDVSSWRLASARARARSSRGSSWTKTVRRLKRRRSPRSPAAS